MVIFIVSAISKILTLSIVVMMEYPFEHYIGRSHVAIDCNGSDALVGSDSP